MQIEAIQIAKNMVDKILQNAPVKILAGILLSTLKFLFEGIDDNVLLALFVLIIFDTITAIGASYKTGAKIQSSKLRRTAVKIVYYFLLVAAGHITENAVIFLSQFIDETIIAFLAVTELISILENTGKMGYAIPQKLLEKLEKYKDNC